MIEEIRTILYDIRPDSEFDESKNFWEDGLLDSLDIMELIERLENKYQIEIDLEYIKGHRFSSYTSIEEIVRSAQNE